MLFLDLRSKNGKGLGSKILNYYLVSLYGTLFHIFGKSDGFVN
jgi:hypothetical protein